MTVCPCPACEGAAADRRGVTNGFEISARLIGLDWSAMAPPETIYRRPSLTFAKQVVEGTLSASRMGDSLCIWATKA